MSTRAFGSDDAASNPFIPQLWGTHGAVTAEHYLSAQAGADVIKAGGNAVDGAVAAVLVECLVNPNMVSLGGECPMLIWSPKLGRVISINGNTAAPGLATPEVFANRGLLHVPDESILSAGVPATLHALVTALREHGTWTFADLAAPAQRLAREGFPVHKGLVRQPRYGLRDLAEKFRKHWPTSAAVYLPGGTVPAIGSLLQNPALADLLGQLGDAERKAGGDRRTGLNAVLDAFYRGEPAAIIERFSLARDGLLRAADLAAFETHEEAPAALDYRDARVFKCGFWNQGPVLLQTLAILEPFDLAAMGHHSVDYLHTVVEAIKLAYADREQYYGDPRQSAVPEAALLSKDYGRLRAGLIDPARADTALRPGDPARGVALLPETERLAGRRWGEGTVHVDAIDHDGMMVSFTPSGGWLRTQEVIPELGFPLTNRLQTFCLGPAHHPNIVAPFKRPRTTISPSLVFRGGRPWMVYGSMGGDQQDQWMLQFLLNRVDFHMSIQEAIEAPKFSSEHFPGFFAPHDHWPARLRIEPRVAPAVLEQLAARGHDLEIATDWTEGYLLAAALDPDSGVIEAGFDPRAEKSEVFPSFALCW